MSHSVVEVCSFGLRKSRTYIVGKLFIRNVDLNYKQRYNILDIFH